jgi:hypothetical protein
MKKHLLLLWGGLILSITVALAQPFDKMTPPNSGAMPQLPDGYVLVKVTNSLTKFDLDFPGGTPKDLLKAIELATGRPLNAIISDDCVDLKISTISVKHVTVAELFAVLTEASKNNERFTVLDPRDRSIGGNGSDTRYSYVQESSYGFSTVGEPTDSSIWYFHWNKGVYQEPWQVLSSTVCRFYQMEPYLAAGYKIEDATTAVETAWKMLGVTNAPDISYHKDTKVLIVVGKQEQVDLVADVLKQLSITPKQKPDDKDLPKSKDQ